MSFSLSPFRQSHPLKEDGLSVCVASCPRRPLGNMDDLQEVFDLGDVGTIILFERQNIHATFMKRIARNAVSTLDTPAFTRWNWTGGENVTNAVPHFHYPQTCFVAPEPTLVPTAVFRRGSVIRAAEKINASDGSRGCFQTALDSIDSKNTTDNFFTRLHWDWSSGNTVDMNSLRCMQNLQRLTRRMHGTLEISLYENGFGMVAIPSKVVHARSLLDYLMRPEKTIWRYFQQK